MVVSNSKIFFCQSIISICESPLIELVKFENEDAIDFNSSSTRSHSSLQGFINFQIQYSSLLTLIGVFQDLPIRFKANFKRSEL